MRYPGTTEPMRGLFEGDIPPIRLTVAAYEGKWRPKGWELLPSSARETYRDWEWTEWEAIRDIVQNSLDESEGYTYGYDDLGFWIADSGGGVAVRDFLFGEAKDKKKPEWARGKFGEGMKLSCLTFLRQGYNIRIRTTNREIWPVFYPVKVGPTEYEDTLHFLWRVFPGGRGTTYHIIGYTGPSFKERFAVNLPAMAILEKVASPITQPRQRYNQLIRAEGMAASRDGGVVYSRDIYFRDIKSPFSYNLWGFPLAPDRHGPLSEEEFRYDMGRLWCGVQKTALLKMFLQMVCDPPKLVFGPKEPYAEYNDVQMDTWNLGRNPVTGEDYPQMAINNKASWNTAWVAAFGRHAVIRTAYGRWDGWVKHLNYTSIEVRDRVRGVLASIIKTDAQLVQESQERLADTEIIEDKQLPSEYLSHLELARSIARSFQVSQVKAANIPRASDAARTAGLYNSTLEVIKIDMEQLKSVVDTIDTVIHEIAHHTAYKATGDISKAEDLTPRHSSEMSQVAAFVVKAAAEGKYDHWLKNARL